MVRKTEPELVPVATFIPGTITLYIYEHSPFGTGKYLMPHNLSRKDAEAIRDSLNTALEHEAAVNAVLGISK